MHIISVREQPEYEKLCDRFICAHCADENSMIKIKDDIHSCIYTESAYPQWYLLMDNQKIVGGAGVVNNDRINDKDFSPILYYLYIKEAYYDTEGVSLLFKKIKQDAAVFGYEKIECFTDQISFYESHGFRYIKESHDGLKIYSTDCYRIKRLGVHSFRKELKQWIILMLCFKAVSMICKVSFTNWADFLAFIGLITLLLAILFKRRYLSMMTIFGYLAGYGIGAVFHSTKVSHFGVSDNWWFIWTYSYLFFLVLGIALDILMKKKKNGN